MPTPATTIVIPPSSPSCSPTAAGIVTQPSQDITGGAAAIPFGGTVDLNTRTITWTNTKTKSLAAIGVIYAILITIVIVQLHQINQLLQRYKSARKSELEFAYYVDVYVVVMLVVVFLVSLFMWPLRSHLVLTPTRLLNDEGVVAIDLTGAGAAKARGYGDHEDNDDINNLAMRKKAALGGNSRICNSHDGEDDEDATESDSMLKQKEGERSPSVSASAVTAAGAIVVPPTRIALSNALIATPSSHQNDNAESATTAFGRGVQAEGDDQDYTLVVTQSFLTWRLKLQTKTTVVRLHRDLYEEVQVDNRSKFPKRFKWGNFVYLILKNPRDAAGTISGTLTGSSMPGIVQGFASRSVSRDVSIPGADEALQQQQQRQQGSEESERCVLLFLDEWAVRREPLRQRCRELTLLINRLIGKQ